MSSSSDIVYTLDASGERQVAGMRLAGGVVCLVGASLIASLGPPLIGWVVVVIGGLAGLGWLVAGTRGLRRAGKSMEYFVALRDDALEVGEGLRVVRVPWEELLSAEVDEERLVVVVRRREGPPLFVEPRFARVSVYDLARVVRERAGRG